MFFPVPVCADLSYKLTNNSSVYVRIEIIIRHSLKHLHLGNHQHLLCFLQWYEDALRNIYFMWEIKMTLKPTWSNQKSPKQQWLWLVTTTSWSVCLAAWWFKSSKAKCHLCLAQASSLSYNMEAWQASFL